MSELVRLRGKIYFTNCTLCTGKPELNSDRHCAAPLNITAPLPFPSNNFLIDQSKNQYDHKCRAVKFCNDTFGITKSKLGSKATIIIVLS